MRRWHRRSSAIATWRRGGTVAAAVSLDPLRWRLTRVLVSEQEPDDGGAGTVYQVLHLARPLLDTLEGSGV